MHPHNIDPSSVECLGVVKGMMQVRGCSRGWMNSERATSRVTELHVVDNDSHQVPHSCFFKLQDPGSVTKMDGGAEGVALGLVVM